MLINRNVKKSFKEWLENYDLDYGDNTIASRVSNLEKIRKAYPNLDEEWEKDRFEGLMKEFEYSSKDFEENRDVRHKIEIKGNKYNGTATYRSVLRLYGTYLDAISGVSSNAVFANYRNKIAMAIDAIRPALKDRTSYNQKDVKVYIADPLVIELNKRFQTDGYTFGKEIVTSSSTRDRYDILGKSEGKPLIIIEIDTHRADQVTKKTVSRVSIDRGSEMIYVSLVYPNKHKNREGEKKECEKYFEFLHNLFSLFGIPQKTFDGYWL